MYHVFQELIASSYKL